MVSKIFWTAWAMMGMVWEMVALLWGKTEWTLSYQIALLRGSPIFWVVIILLAWAIAHFLLEEIGGIKGVFR